MLFIELILFKKIHFEGGPLGGIFDALKPYFTGRPLRPVTQAGHFLKKYF